MFAGEYSLKPVAHCPICGESLWSERSRRTNGQEWLYTGGRSTRHYKNRCNLVDRSKVTTFDRISIGEEFYIVKAPFDGRLKRTPLSHHRGKRHRAKSVDYAGGICYYQIGDKVEVVRASDCPCPAEKEMDG